jgi:nucleoside-diphosphate-sugar epimerase
MIRILFTGASSFTGAWFVRALADRGADVIAACRGRLADGDADRRRRLASLAGRCRLVESCPFGSEPFRELLRTSGSIDVFCHHGTKSGDHRDPGLDVLGAVAAHTLSIEPTLDALMAAGCRTLLLTGTVFEADEGLADPPAGACSPYGLAKTLTWQMFRHHAERRGLTLGKLVIASPFGPLEKPGLTRHLATGWLDGRTPVLRCPQLVRDHLQVPLLAAAYARFALDLPGREGVHRLTPSQFAEPLDRFAGRLAGALAPRLRLPCRFACAALPEPTDEPARRCGTDPLERLVPDLDPEQAWDAYAASLLGETEPTITG